MKNINGETIPPKTVLLVDDDDALRPALAKAIEKMGLKVIAVRNGKIAAETLVSESIDLVVSDIQMPEMNGVELTRHIRGINPGLPIILMTAFSAILEAKEAHAVGANEFFPKPFERLEMEAAICRCLGMGGETSGPSEGESELDYCALGIEEFASGRLIKFGIYVRLSESKFVRVAHRGEDLPIDRVRAFMAKGITYLYLRAVDFRAYVDFNLALTEAVRGSRSIASSTKLKLLKHTGEILLEQIRLEGVQTKNYQSAAAYVSTVVKVISDDQEILGLLENLSTHADYLYAHGVAVSVFSVMMARVEGWVVPANLFKVGMAGLLHDVGEKEIDKEILMKPRRLWTADDAKIHETHPQRGFDSLRAIQAIPEDVLMIVKEHHENCLGTGYPARKKKTQTAPMAKLIAVANELCERIMKTPDGPGVTPAEAVRDIVSFSAERFDPQFLAAMCKVCGFPQEKAKSGASHD